MVTQKLKFSLFSLILFLLLSEVIFGIFQFMKNGIYGFPLNLVRPESHSETVPWPDIHRLYMNPKTGKLIPGDHPHPDGKSTFHVNRHGFRGKEFTTDKSTKHRLICLGGSVVFGHKSLDHETYPAVIESELNRRGYDTEVLNFGIQSKPLTFVEHLIFSEAYRYKPDVLIINSNWNTVSSDAFIGKEALSRLLMRAHESDKLLTSALDVKILRLHLRLRDNSMLYFTMSEFIPSLLKQDLNPASKDDPHRELRLSRLHDYFFTEYENSIHRIADLGKNNGFKVLLVKQANVISPDQFLRLESMSPQEIWNGLKNLKHAPINPDDFDRNMVMGQRIYMLIATALLNKLMDSISESHENIWVVDPVRDQIRNSQASPNGFFEDPLHLNPAGNRFLGETIADFINETKLLEVSK